MRKYKRNNVIRFTENCSFEFTNPKKHIVNVEKGKIVKINSDWCENSYSIDKLCPFQTVNSEKIDSLTELVHENYDESFEKEINHRIYILREKINSDELKKLIKEVLNLEALLKIIENENKKNIWISI